MSDDDNDGGERRAERQGRGPRTGRRAVLRSLGLAAGAVGISTLSRRGTAVGASDVACATGPFERTFESVPQHTDDVGTPDWLPASSGDIDMTEVAEAARAYLKQLPPEGAEAVEEEGFPPSLESALEHAPNIERMVEEARENNLSVPEAVDAIDAPEMDASGEGLSVLTEFDGPFDWRGDPSDANIAAGPNDLLVGINVLWAVYGKGGSLRGTFDLVEWFLNLIDQDEFFLGFPFITDPWVRYDPERDRFYMVAIFYSFLENVGYYLFSVSDDGDPLGRWHNYAIEPVESSGFVDYPKLGFDSEAVYLTQNFFDVTENANVFDQAELAILDKDALCRGEPVTASFFQDLRNPDGTKAFTVQPAEQPLIDEEADASRPYFLLNAYFRKAPTFDPTVTGSGESLTLWTVEDPIDDPTLTCRSVDVPPYGLFPLVEQPETESRLDFGDTRLLNLAYDEDDDTLWTAHAVVQNWNGDDGGAHDHDHDVENDVDAATHGDLVSAIRWYEVDPFEGELVQTGLWGEPGKSYSFPTVNVNDDAMMMAYSVSGPDTYPRMDVAGRTDDFAPGELEDSTVVQEGESAYLGFPGEPVQRWGDYWGVSVDPERGTFWNVAQYSPDADPRPLFGSDIEWDPYAIRIAETAFFDGDDEECGDGGV